jgi:signal peptidase I
MIRKILAGLAVVLFGLIAVAFVFTDHSYVTTPSMYPTIQPGSEIFVSHEAHYHIGQVIEFRGNGLIWAHRLVNIKPNGDFITKGDNPENARDVFVPALTQAGVIGAVTHAPRWFGFPELIVHHPSYGLAWLRAELGLSGKIGLVGVIGLLSLLSASGGRRSTATAGDRRMHFSARPEDILRDSVAGRPPVGPRSDGGRYPSQSPSDIP